MRNNYHKRILGMMDVESDKLNAFSEEVLAISGVRRRSDRALFALEWRNTVTAKRLEHFPAFFLFSCPLGQILVQQSGDNFVLLHCDDDSGTARETFRNAEEAIEIAKYNDAGMSEDVLN